MKKLFQKIFIWMEALWEFFLTDLKVTVTNNLSISGLGVEGLSRLVWYLNRAGLLKAG